MKTYLTRFKKPALLLLICCSLLPASLLSQQPELISKVYANDVEGVKGLIAAGTDLNVREEFYSMTPLILACSSGKVSFELAELLLAKGAEIDEVNTTEYYGGYTPLFRAVDDNNEKLVTFLVENGANVNASADNGKTPLALASEAGYESIAGILKANGAR